MIEISILEGLWIGEKITSFLLDRHFEGGIRITVMENFIIALIICFCVAIASIILALVVDKCIGDGSPIICDLPN